MPNIQRLTELESMIEHIPPYALMTPFLSSTCYGMNFDRPETVEFYSDEEKIVALVEYESKNDVKNAGMTYFYLRCGSSCHQPGVFVVASHSQSEVSEKIQSFAKSFISIQD